MKNLLKHWALFLLIAHCILIFGFSAQNKSQSSASSMRITEKIVARSEKKEMKAHERAREKREIEVKVRKSAHFFLYAILGMLAYLTAKKYLKSRYGFGAMVFGLLYAISDEIHQEFVPGRAGLKSDVMIDFAGVVLGVLIVYLFQKKKRRKKI